MTKQEFIQEAALRLIGARPTESVYEIHRLAKTLADRVYEDEQETPSEPDQPAPAVSDPGNLRSASLYHLLNEIDKIEAADVEERKKSGFYSQMAGFGVRLANVFSREEIETVGDLLDTGSREMLKKKDVGPGCISLLRRALKNLYNIENW